MNAQQFDLGMTFSEIREAIDLEKREWINHDSTNCYAYALGLDIPQKRIANYAYSPGVISHSKIFLPELRTFPYEYLIQNLMQDFEALGITCTESNTSDALLSDEWKIALFLTGTKKDIVDFHFLRQLKDGNWYHKNGWKYGIRDTDDYGQRIINPEECYLRDRTYDRCLALTLKK